MCLFIYLFKLYIVSLCVIVYCTWLEVCDVVVTINILLSISEFLFSQVNLEEILFHIQIVYTVTNPSIISIIQVYSL